MAGYPQLSHEKHVEGSVETARNLPGDRDATSGQRKDDDIRSSGVLAEA
jgi:hypothetical protein